MADWAYGVSLMDLSEYCIGKALDLDSLEGRWSKVAVRRSQKGGVLMEMGKDNNLNSLAISLVQLGEIAFKAGDTSSAIKAYNECVKVCTDTRQRLRKRIFCILNAM